jgi:hypothetical protein
MIIAFYPGAGGNRYLRMLKELKWTDSNTSYDRLVSGQEFKHRYLTDDVSNGAQDFILTHCLNEPHIRSKFPNHNIVFILGNFKKCLQREWILAGHERYIQKNIQHTYDYDRIEHYNAFKDNSWPACFTINDIENLPVSILNEITQEFKKIQKRQNATNMLADLENRIIGKVNSAYEIICWHKNYYDQYPLLISNESTVIDINCDEDIFSKTMQKELDFYNSEIFDEVWKELNV